MLTLAVCACPPLAPYMEQPLQVSIWTTASCTATDRSTQTQGSALRSLSASQARHCLTTCHPWHSEPLNPKLISYRTAPRKADVHSFSCPPTAEGFTLLHTKLCCDDTQPPPCSSHFLSHVPPGYVDRSTHRKQESCLYTDFILLRTSSETCRAEDTGVFMGSKPLCSKAQQ